MDSAKSSPTCLLIPDRFSVRKEVGLHSFQCQSNSFIISESEHRVGSEKKLSSCQINIMRFICTAFVFI